MPPSSPPDQPSIRTPHPLAERLIVRLRDRPGARVLELGTGSGRNAAALVRAGFEVVPVEDSATIGPASAIAAEPVAAILSTHGLLHGTASQVCARLAACVPLLEPHGLLYATFGSTQDARFERGVKIDAQTYAPAAGDERGVPHAYFTESELCALLKPYFDVETLAATGVDAIAGSWAHQKRPLDGGVHWFAVARRCAQAEA